MFGPAGAAPGLHPARARSSPTSATSRPPRVSRACSRRPCALHEKVLPPSLNFRTPNPNIDWASSPFARQHRTARLPGRRVRRRVRRASARSASAGPTSMPSSRSTFPAGTGPTSGVPIAGVDVPQASTAAAPAARGRLRPARGRRSGRPGGEQQQGAASRGPRRRRCQRQRPRPPPRRRRGIGGVRRGEAAGRTGSRRPARTGPGRDRLRRCSRVGGQGGAGPEGRPVRPAGGVEDAALARSVLRSRAGPEDSIPLHGPGIAVREHAQGAARSRTHRGGHVR